MRQKNRKISAWRSSAARTVTYQKFHSEGEEWVTEESPQHNNNNTHNDNTTPRKISRRNVAVRPLASLCSLASPRLCCTACLGDSVCLYLYTIIPFYKEIDCNLITIAWPINSYYCEWRLESKKENEEVKERGIWSSVGYPMLQIVPRNTTRTLPCCLFSVSLGTVTQLVTSRERQYVKSTIYGGIFVDRGRQSSGISH